MDVFAKKSAENPSPLLGQSYQKIPHVHGESLCSHHRPIHIPRFSIDFPYSHHAVDPKNIPNVVAPRQPSWQASVCPHRVQHLRPSDWNASGCEGTRDYTTRCFYWIIIVIIFNGKITNFMGKPWENHRKTMGKPIAKW